MLAAEKRISIILMLISLSFLVLTAPVFILENLDMSFYEHPRGELILSIAYALMYSNHVINFFFYCSFGPNFRNEVKRLFGRGNRIKAARDFKLTRLNAVLIAAASTTLNRHSSRRMALVAPNYLPKSSSMPVKVCLPNAITTTTLLINNKPDSNIIEETFL